MAKPKREPVNKKLYEQVKEEAKGRFKNWPSAYGSQWLVKTYKARGGTYKGEAPTDKEGVRRWNKEEWVDEYGNPCGSDKNKNTKKCRPKKRVTSKTPVTWNEMDDKEKKRAIKEKKKIGMGKKAKAVSPRRSKTSPRRSKK